MDRERGWQGKRTMDQEPALRKIADPRFRRLCEGVVEAMGSLNVPGTAVGVFHEGEEQVAGFGVTSVEHPLRVNADTLFQIGSITKTFTGTAAMRLVEMGRLDLDVPIRAYLPDLRLADEAVTARVTMRHLLNHTGGWVGDYFDDTGFGDDALAKMVARMAELPQVTPLGEVWSYNNSGFYLAGRVIEAITGKSFEAAVKESVLDPLGMMMSFFFATDMVTHRFVVGHHAEDGPPEVARPWGLPRSVNPAGGVLSNVRDLLRYARFHMGDEPTPQGSALLTPESMTLMQSPQVAAGGEGFLGITWFTREIQGTRIVGHGGGTNGQITTLAIVPEHNFAIVILTNADSGGELIQDVTEQAFRQYLELKEPDPEPLELPEEKLAPYTGRYDTPLEEVQLRLRDSRLVMEIRHRGGFPTKDSPPLPSPPPAPLIFYENERVLVPNGPMKGARGDFSRDSEGNITWFRIGGRVHVRQTE